MSENQAPLLIIIDGHSLAFRAYYALGKSKKGALRTSKGIPTSVCVGFLNSLLQIIDDYKPKYLAIAFDRKEATFRHEADINYKANREETPKDFIEDFINLKELLNILNLQTITKIGYEADDIIATLTKKGIENDYQIKIVSGDRDLFQLIDDKQNVSVLYLEQKTGTSNEFKEENVVTKLRIKPNQVVDYKALCGDKSDNIPGVLGIGEKTAVKLLKQYQTLDNIYDNIELIKGNLKNKLIKGEKDAKHSQYLAQLVNDISLEIDLENFKLKGFDTQKLITKFQELELNKFLQKINQIQQQLGGKVENFNLEINDKNTQQLSLFVNPNETQIKPKIINNPNILEELITILKEKTDENKPVAWDTETTSLNTRESQLVGIGCCWGKDISNIAYIPINHTQITEKQLDFKTIKKALQPILENSNYPKAFHHTKFDRLVLLNQGINLTGVVFDTMLASYILNPEESHKLSNLSRKYLTNITALDYENLGISKDNNIADLDIINIAQYCGKDAYATFNLVSIFQDLLKDNLELKELFKLEMQLEPILAQMETSGIKIDQEYLEQLSQIVAEELTKIEQEAYENAGETFNLNSPQQLSELLFNKLGLNKRKSRKIKTGYSTNHSVLEKLQGDHPIIDQILSYRTLAKLKSTYIDSLPTLINPKTQRIHTDYNQMITSTGRLSSSNPNLQNIPIRSKFSRQIRQAFIPQKDCIFLSADYSQIELRILAHLSQEPILLEAYQTNKDIHTVTAQLLFEHEEISPEERNLGKTINFGVIYGMGANKFAKQTKVSLRDAKIFIEKYHQKYAQVFAYLEKMKKQAIVNGYVTTILGRRRYFEFNNQSLKKLKGIDYNLINLSTIKYNNYDAQLLRGAANAPIQGSSADIIKKAMIKIAKILENYEAKLLLQVHDELVFEIPNYEVEELSIKIKETMENIMTLTIPLKVDIHTGKNWMEAK